MRDEGRQRRTSLVSCVHINNVHHTPTSVTASPLSHQLFINEYPVRHTQGKQDGGSKYGGNHFIYSLIISFSCIFNNPIVIVNRTLIILSTPSDRLAYLYICSYNTSTRVERPVRCPAQNLFKSPNRIIIERLSKRNK